MGLFSFGKKKSSVSSSRPTMADTVKTVAKAAIMTIQDQLDALVSLDKKLEIAYNDECKKIEDFKASSASVRMNHEKFNRSYEKSKAILDERHAYILELNKNPDENKAKIDVALQSYATLESTLKTFEAQKKRNDEWEVRNTEALKKVGDHKELLEMKRSCLADQIAMLDALDKNSDLEVGIDFDSTFNDIETLISDKTIEITTKQEVDRIVEGSSDGNTGSSTSSSVSELRKRLAEGTF